MQAKNTTLQHTTQVKGKLSLSQHQQLTKEIVKVYPRSGKAKRLDTITETVVHNSKQKDSSALILQSRIQNQQIKKVGQSLKTNYEIQHNKNTRHTYCGYISKAEYIKIIENNSNKKYHYNGFTSCKMIWRCPTCSYKILKARAKEIYKLTSSHLNTKNQCGFVTLTIRHKKYDKLKTNNDKIIQSFRNFQNSRYFKSLKTNKLIGQIKAFEHTYTQKNGWHPHLHIIFFWNTKSESEVNQIQKELIQKWANYTKGSINAQNQKPIYSLGEIANYITKWDSIEELTNTQNKSSKGIAPFQFLKMLNNNELLFDYTNQQKSNQKLKSLWLEYIEATKGNRRITISKKLNELYKIQSKTDEQILDQKHEGKTIIAFSRQIGVLIFEQNIQAYLINICYENDTLQKQQNKLIEFIKQFSHIHITMDKDLLVIHSKTNLN